MDIKGFIKSINHFAEHTKKAYEQTLWQLRHEIQGEEPTTAEIERFLRKYPLSTLRRHMAAIKAYWEFANPKEKWQLSEKYFGIVKRKVPKSVSPEIVQEIAKQAGCEDDRMFVLTLYELGCSMPSLMNLEVEDVKSTVIQVRVKGGKYHRVPMTKKFLKKFQTYCKNKKYKIYAKPYTYYYKLLKKLGAKVHHPEMTPQILRHSRVVHLVRNGMPLPMVQRFIGQVTINTKEIYLDIEQNMTELEISRALEKADPGLLF